MTTGVYYKASNEYNLSVQGDGMTAQQDIIKEMQDRLDKQEKFLAEIITWLKEYFPNMGFTPELREEEWKVLIGNIQLISKGKKPKRREEIEEEMEAQREEEEQA